MTNHTAELRLVRTRVRLQSVGLSGLVSGATGGFALDQVAGQPVGFPVPTQPHKLIGRYYDGIVVATHATGRELSGVFDYRTNERGYAALVKFWSEAETAPVREVLGEDTDLGDLEALAAAVANETPSVESTRPEVPELTGNLVTDVRRLSGLTANDLATAFGRTERAIQGWRRHGPPQEFEQPLRALEAVGLTLVGGLGPLGVKRWLTSGHPSALQRIAAGQTDEVVEELGQYEDFIAT